MSKQSAYSHLELAALWSAAPAEAQQAASPADQKLPKMDQRGQP
jgi:hypothetical protein